MKVLDDNENICRTRLFHTRQSFVVIGTPRTMSVYPVTEIGRKLWDKMRISLNSLMFYGALGSVIYLCSDSRKEAEFVCVSIAYLAFYAYYMYRLIHPRPIESEPEPRPEHSYADTVLDGVNLGWSIDEDTSSQVVFSKGQYRVALSKKYQVLQAINPSVNHNFQTFSEIEAWIKRGCPTL